MLENDPGWPNFASPYWNSLSNSRFAMKRQPSSPPVAPRRNVLRTGYLDLCSWIDSRRFHRLHVVVCCGAIIVGAICASFGLKATSVRQKQFVAQSQEDEDTAAAAKKKREAMTTNAVPPTPAPVVTAPLIRINLPPASGMNASP
jgi:hypothetical protein